MLLVLSELKSLILFSFFLSLSICFQFFIEFSYCCFFSTVNQEAKEGAGKSVKEVSKKKKVSQNQAKRDSMF